MRFSRTLLLNMNNVLEQILYLIFYRPNKAKIEQTRSDVDRVEEQLRESEHARKEAEDRATKLEEEALSYEQQMTELQAKIRVSLPDSES